MGLLKHIIFLLPVVLVLFKLKITMGHVIAGSFSLILMRITRSQSGRDQGLCLTIRNIKL